MDTERKRQKEKEVLNHMIKVYCRGSHRQPDKNTLCCECRELLDYAMHRSDKCPFMETKTFCSNCKVHCYKPDMREKIRKVMKYSGPRMLFYHPLMTLNHFILNFKEKRDLEKEKRAV